MVEPIYTELFVGARGWDHDGWQDAFYPADLPPDWRLTYYANEYATVLVPAASWQSAAADPDAWVHDTPDTFCFVLEARLSQRAQAMQFAQRLGTRLDAILLRDADALVQDLARLEQVLSETSWPMNLALEQPLSEEAAAMLHAHGGGQVWAPGRTGPAGTVPMALIGGERPLEASAIRAMLEQFMAFARGHSRALLFFDGEPPGINNLLTAKTVAALLGY